MDPGRQRCAFVILAKPQDLWDDEIPLLRFAARGMTEGGSSQLSRRRWEMTAETPSSRMVTP
jgi:hypothetical protein